MTPITPDNLVAAGLTNPATAAKVADSLAKACAKYGIDSDRRVAMFLAQTSHESSGFRITQENLNYSAARLVQVWPKRFDARTAIAYDHKPEMIANRVYADRLGNGPEMSGDGWRYRGRGLIQLTGRSNYAAFGAESNPDDVAAPALAAMSAGWFWSKNGLNKLADAEDVLAVTKRINGGTLGLEERKKLYSKARAVFAG
jgi:putative chitinase